MAPAAAQSERKRNTTNLTKHLSKIHSEVHKELQLKRAAATENPAATPTPRPRYQSTLEAAFQKGKTYPDDSPRAGNITDLIAKMICLDLQPISIVEDRGFNALMKYVDPSFKMPSRKKIKEETITHMYTAFCNEVKRTLENAESVVLTTDMWTSRSTQSYLTVTCHFVHDWQMVEYVLEANCFTEQHTAANISLALKRITDHWGITQKVAAVITDNGANVVAAVHQAGWTHYPCFAHTLNLVVKDAIKAVPEIVNLLHKCSAIVTFFHHSSKATEKLSNLQKQLDMPEHKLIHEEMNLIQPTIEALRLYEQATQEISSSKQVSMSKLHLYLKQLHLYLKHLHLYLKQRHWYL
ncbi:zinc finger BED domain-containing protein 4-like [Syngnathus typhle]|uniref:zinc finger BED domain-containing protein 4-like n=1 Tax=Syngnathus typhle TaxID=161592 RepID=UPI002A6A08B7|nr:zinc finger BED domain-containing protein 4-like [Syngnathus typhle]